MIIARTAATFALLASVAACAKGPDAIAPVSMQGAFAADLSPVSSSRLG